MSALRRLVAALLSLLMVGTVAGCSSSGSQPQSTPSASIPDIKDLGPEDPVDFNAVAAASLPRWRQELQTISEHVSDRIVEFDLAPVGFSNITVVENDRRLVRYQMFDGELKKIQEFEPSPRPFLPSSEWPLEEQIKAFDMSVCGPGPRYAPKVRGELTPSRSALFTMSCPIPGDRHVMQQQLDGQELSPITDPYSEQGLAQLFDVIHKLNGDLVGRIWFSFPYLNSSSSGLTVHGDWVPSTDGKTCQVRYQAHKYFLHEWEQFCETSDTTEEIFDLNSIDRAKLLAVLQDPQLLIKTYQYVFVLQENGQLRIQCVRSEDPNAPSARELVVDFDGNILQKT